MIPTFMRKGRTRKPGASKEWNPATFYIVMFTLIGSQAIRMLTLKNNYAAYRRTTDAKIELLREVIQRVKNGEKVDVERLLGTGDEAKEKEWVEGELQVTITRRCRSLTLLLLVLQEIEQEDLLWQQKQKPAREPTQEDSTEKPPTQKSEGKESAVPFTASADEETMRKTQSTRKLNFF